MLNVTFTGEVVNGGGVNTDCYYKAYFPTQNIYSQTRTTEYFQYSINAGDSDCLTQDGILLADDKIILIFWTGVDSIDNLTTSNQFSYIEITYNNQPVYNINVKIFPPIAPCVNISNQPTNYVGIDTPITTSVNTSQIVTYMNNQFKQTELIFTKLEVKNSLINYGDTNTGLDLIHIYNQTGNFELQFDVTNKLNLTSNNNSQIQILYGTPEDIIFYTPIDLYVGDEFTINSEVSNLYNNIIEIKRYLENTLVNSGFDLSYSDTFTVSAPYKTNYIYYDEIVYNDGFEQKTIKMEQQIPILSRPPTITITDNQESNISHTIIPQYSSPDGEIVNIEWYLIQQIQKYNSDEIVEVLLFDSNKIEDFSNLILTLNKAGQYIVRCTVYDSFDNSATDSLGISVVCSTTDKLIYIRNDTSINCDIIDFTIYDEVINIETIDTVLYDCDMK